MFCDTLHYIPRTSTGAAQPNPVKLPSANSAADITKTILDISCIEPVHKGITALKRYSENGLASRKNRLR